MTVSWTAQNVERLIALVAAPEHHSSETISAMLGCATAKGVAHKIHRLGLRLGDAPTFWTPEREAALLQLVEQEKGDGQIAQALGAASPGAVSAKLRHLGIKREPWWNAHRIEILRQMAADRKSSVEVAAALGTKRGAVANKAVSLGITFNSRVARPPKSPARPRPAKVSMDGVWTVERTERIKAMWLDGATARQISTAERCGLTPAAVISKMDRLGLCVPEISALRAQRAVPKTTLVAHPPIPVAMRQRPANDMSKVLADLEAGECRFPVGADPGPGNMDRQFFCASPVADGRFYCTECCGVAFRMPEKAAAQAEAARRMRDAIPSRRRYAA